VAGQGSFFAPRWGCFARAYCRSALFEDPPHSGSIDLRGSLLRCTCMHPAQLSAELQEPRRAVQNCRHRGRGGSVPAVHRAAVAPSAGGGPRRSKGPGNGGRGRWRHPAPTTAASRAGATHTHTCRRGKLGGERARSNSSCASTGGWWRGARPRRRGGFRSGPRPCGARVRHLDGRVPAAPRASAAAVPSRASFASTVPRAAAGRVILLRRTSRLGPRDGNGKKIEK